MGGLTSRHWLKFKEYCGIGEERECVCGCLMGLGHWLKFKITGSVPDGVSVAQVGGRGSGLGTQVQRISV